MSLAGTRGGVSLAGEGVFLGDDFGEGLCFGDGVFFEEIGVSFEGEGVLLVGVVVGGVSSASGSCMTTTRGCGQFCCPVQRKSM